MLLNLFCSVQCKVALQLLLNLKVVFGRRTSVPNRDEVLVVLLRPPQILSQTSNHFLNRIHLSLLLSHLLLKIIQLPSLFSYLLLAALFILLLLPHLHLPVVVL